MLKVNDNLLLKLIRNSIREFFKGDWVKKKEKNFTSVLMKDGNCFKLRIRPLSRESPSELKLFLLVQWMDMENYKKA